MIGWLGGISRSEMKTKDIKKREKKEKKREKGGMKNFLGQAGESGCSWLHQLTLIPKYCAL